MSRLIQPVSSFGVENLANADFKNIVLSVIVSDDGLSFLALKDNLPVAFEIFNSVEISAVANASSLAGKDFKSVQIIVNNRFYTLTPKGLVMESDKKNIIENLFGIKDFDVFLSDTDDMEAVFAFDKNAVNQVNKLWPGAPVIHFADILLSEYNKMKGEDERVFMHISDKYFWAALYSDGNLKLFNSYEFSGKNDFGYFALGIIENAGFDNRTVKTFLSGNVSEDAPLLQLLKKYLPEVKLISKDDIPAEFTAFFHFIKYFQK